MEIYRGNKNNTCCVIKINWWK